MNWPVTGTRADGKPAALTIVGGPDSEQGLRELLPAAQPGFTMISATPGIATVAAPAAPAPARGTRMDRDRFFQRPPVPKTTEITIDGFGTVKARKLTAAEVETIRKSYGSDDKALAGFRFIVTRCVVDDDGDRLFKDEDADKLREVDFDVVNAIASAIVEFSGIGEKKA